jgi:dTDP-4-dehydrorhamnose reductase
MVFERLPGAAVVRAQWLYGKGGKSFVDTITELGRQHGRVRVVDDRGGPDLGPGPCRADHLHHRERIERDLSRLEQRFLHLVRIRKAIFSILNMDIEVSPISSGELGRKAIRPAFSVFDLTKFKGATGIRMRDWTDALREYLVTGG